MRISAQNQDFHVNYSTDSKITTITTNIYGKECVLASHIMGLEECFDLINLFDSQNPMDLYNTAKDRL